MRLERESNADLIGRKVRISPTGRAGNPNLSVYSGKDIFTVRAVYIDTMKVRKAMLECSITRCMFEVSVEDLVISKK